jgi:hypothetical protein
MPLLSFAAVILLGTTVTCSTQSSSSSASQQDTSKPASASSTPSASQSQQASGTQQTPQAQTKTANPSADESGKKKPKKVWTNDELGSAKGGVSVVGDHSGGQKGATASSSSSSSSSYSYTPPTNYEVVVQTYLDRLAPLRSDLADIDRNIQKAKDAMGNAREDTAAWIHAYEEKRHNVLAKIDAIEEEARKRGVAPGDLR